MKVINDRGVHRNLQFPLARTCLAVAERCPRQDVPVALPGCPRAGRAAARSRGGSSAGFARGQGSCSRDHHPETFPSSTAPPARRALTLPGARLSPQPRYSPHFAAGTLSRRVWSGGLTARSLGTASPLSQRSAVRLISVRRFASVCAPMCVRVWSCLAFSMQVTPSRACSRSPHPGRQADLPASEPSSRPPLPPLRRGAALRSSIQPSFCLP